jgi:NAD(P)-dependent dehydrogenase (short-subunit alcohol dehydrogenase family)
MKSKGVQIMTNKIAIITGGSRGLGRNTVVNLARRWMHRTAGRAQRGARPSGISSGPDLGDIHFIEIEMTRNDTVTVVAAQEIEARYGRGDS